MQCEMSHGSTSVARTSDRLDEHPGTGRGKTIECTAHPPAQEEASAWGGDETRNGFEPTKHATVSNLRPSCTNLTPTCATASGSALLALAVLVPHSSMAASTVTDPSSQGATTRHAARRRGSDTRHDDASLLGSHRLISAGGWDQEGGVDVCAEVVAPSVTSQRTRRTQTAAPRRGTGHAGAPVKHGERA